MNRVTLEQVAQAAGVSTATVDRVLNDRPGVRTVTAERVKAAVAALNYQPDRLAARLARASTYRFGFILPPGDNVFMRTLETEAGHAAERLRPERVHVSVIHENVFDGAALARTLDGIDEGYDGIAVIALDHPAVREAIDALVARGVRVVTLVSDLPGSRRDRFVGIDNFAAGRTAASLLGRFCAGRTGKVALIAGSFALRDHAERKHGFEQVIADEYPDLQVLPAMEGHDDNTRSAAAAGQVLRGHPDLLALYSVGAGNDGIIDAVRALDRRDLVFVGHELTPATRKALLDGVVDAVINQDAGHEVRSALRILEALVEDRPIVQTQERIRIDIYMRDNMPPMGVPAG